MELDSEQNTDIKYNMEEYQNIMWKKNGYRKCHMLLFHLYKIFKSLNYEDEKPVSSCLMPGGGTGINSKSWWNSLGFSKFS